MEVCSKALTADKYKDLGLDLEEYQSGALDLKALTEDEEPMAAPAALAA